MGAQGMDRLLSAERPPTAVFAFCDEVAMGALRSLRRAGIPVPHAMSVVGIDDHPIADLWDLTTVRQPVELQGVRSARMALALLGGGPVDRPAPDGPDPSGHPRHDGPSRPTRELVPAADGWHCSAV